MIEPADLARAARRALADAHTATLLVEGLGRVSPDPGHVLLADVDGRPRFTCATGSPVAAAALTRRPAVLDVGSSTPGAPRVGSVLFAGHLASTEPATDEVEVVELRLVSVTVELADPHSHTPVARRVPLDVYGSRS